MRAHKQTHKQTRRSQGTPTGDEVVNQMNCYSGSCLIDSTENVVMTACTVVQAVVNATSQSNGKGPISYKLLS